MQIKKCNTIVNYIELRYEIYYKVKLTMHFMQKSWQYLFIVMCYLVDLAKHYISSIILCTTFFNYSAEPNSIHTSFCINSLHNINKYYI